MQPEETRSAQREDTQLPAAPLDDPVSTSSSGSMRADSAVPVPIGPCASISFSTSPQYPEYDGYTALAPGRFKDFGETDLEGCRAQALASEE